MSRCTCPLCGGDTLLPILRRPHVPVFQNGLYADHASALAATDGALAITLCRQCGFVFNADFDSARIAYGDSYENDQTVSGVFAAHVDRMADRVLTAVAGVDRPVVLEVGCGQGYFLHRLARRSTVPLAGALGFDPAFRGEGHFPDGVVVQSRLFDAAAAAEIDAPISVIVSRHVIEHVDDPVGFLSAIRAALRPGSMPRLFLETPCVRWILAGGVVQDFFYEHCSYFTLDTLRYALKRAGWTPVAGETVFEDQYLWLEAQPDWTAAGEASFPDATGLADLAIDFADRTNGAVAHWRQLLIERGKVGPVAVWGAAAKGTTFVTTIDPGADTIDCLIDVNPKKQCGFTPLTGHPILSPKQAAARGVRTAIIMNPNYRDEIAALCRAEAFSFDLLDG